MNAPGASATLDDWLQWQMTLSPSEINLGLDRVAEVYGRMNLPRPRRVLTVAGTNGKGSCVIMLHALHRALGECVGAYISPHILDYEERIRVNDALARADDIVAAFRQVEAARREVPLTYFEYGTLAAFAVFAEAGVDTAILEVGLGGRLDAVNIIDHDGCLITNVSMDHSEWLGDSIEKIAREKAGVMRPGVPAVFGASDAPAAILERARETGADLRLRGRDFDWQPACGDDWQWTGRQLSIDGLRKPALDGRYQYDNAAAVIALLEAIGATGLLRADRINEALGRLRFSGRMQRIDAHGRHWLLDGAHNAAGARALADSLGENGDRAAVTVLGILGDKDANGIIRSLAEVSRRFVTLRPESERGIDADALAAMVAAAGCDAEAAASGAGAMQRALEQTVPGDLIVVAGSFYTLGPALRWLGHSAA